MKNMSRITEVVAYHNKNPNNKKTVIFYCNRCKTLVKQAWLNAHLDSESHNTKEHSSESESYDFLYQKLKSSKDRYISKEMKIYDSNEWTLYFNEDWNTNSLFV